MVPGAFQVGAQLQKPVALFWSYRRLPLARDELQLILKLSLVEEAFIPAPLQFRSDEPVVGIDRIILAARPSRLVSGLLKRQLGLTTLLVRLCIARFDRLDRGLDAQRLQELKDLGADGLIDTQGTEGDAAIPTMVKKGTTAMVAANVAVGATVGDMQLPAAVSTAKTQQRPSSPCCWQ